MNGRVVLSLVGLLVIAVSFFLLFEYPAFADEAFVLLLAWMVMNFVLLYAMRPRGPPVPSGSSAEPSPFPSGGSAAAPLPSQSSSPSSGPTGSGSSLDFCVYCAAPVSPGARVCPACGHAVPQW